MRETLKQKLDRIGQEAEDHEALHGEEELPPHVTVTRPGLARSRSLQVRLNPNEFAALERLARQRGLPVSTLARAKLLELIDDEGGDDSTLDVVAQLLTLAAQIGPGAAHRISQQLDAINHRRTSRAPRGT